MEIYGKLFSNLFTMKEYIAYSGEVFTIEWYFDSTGSSDVLDYFNEQSNIQKEKKINHWLENWTMNNERRFLL